MLQTLLASRTVICYLPRRSLFDHKFGQTVAVASRKTKIE
jgi:hypothetical protein